MRDAKSQSGLYEFAASIDPQYTAAFTFGCALVGFGVSLLKLTTKAIFSNNLRLDSGSFFLCNGFVVLGCIWALFRVLSILNYGHNTQIKRSDDDYVDNIEDDSNPGDDDNEAPDLDQTPTYRHQNICLLAFIPFYWETLCMIQIPLIAEFLNYFFTISFFPGPMSTIVSTEGLVSFGTWLSIVLITTFNAGDCLGRFVLNKLKALSTPSIENENEPIIQAASSLSSRWSLA